MIAQLLVDAIKKDGSRDGDKVNKAIRETDMMTNYRHIGFYQKGL